jgi:plasmid maintenance system killer protein
MIKSFGDKQTAKFWQGENVKLPSEMLRRAMDKLYLIEHSTSIDDL